jgi:FkbM family methyltransferase
MGRGQRWHDKLLILILVIFRSRPGFWRLVAAAFGAGDWVLTVRTPCGPARLVFDPQQTAELAVVDELLPGRIYIANSRASVLLDCGAFRGISTIYLQDQAKAARVVAFEPQVDNFTVLSRRLAKHLPTATVVNAAVGHSNGEALFDGNGVGGSISAKGSRVRVVRVRDEIRCADKDVLLMKIDIEGAERDLLPDVQGALPINCTIFLETHFAEGTAEAILAPLFGAGFSRREIRRHQHGTSGVQFIDWELKR